MKKINMLVGEFILLFASIFIFRSVWAFLDQVFGNAYLLEFLAVGIILTVAGLLLLNYEVECEINGERK